MSQPSGPADPDGSADEADDSSGRSASTQTLWAEVQIDPIEIALPGGVGYTLRAYRPATDIEAPDTDPEAPADLDDFDAASAAVAAHRRSIQGDTDADPDVEAEADDLEEFEAEFPEDQFEADEVDKDDEDEVGAEESDEDAAEDSDEDGAPEEE